MASIKEIAREAGVSVSTVSYALNGTRPISEPTRRRILEVVKRMNYRPDARGRSLGAMRTGVVGVVAPELTAYFVAPLLSGVDRALWGRGYRLLLAHANREQDFLHLFDKGQVDGIIALVSGRETWRDEWTGQVQRLDLPCVVVNRRVPGVPCVLTHYRMAAVLAVKHLLARGHRRIGFVGEHPGDATQTMLLEGYRQALSRAGATTDPFLVAPDSTTAVARWGENKERPTAAFVAGQDHTFLFYRLARQYGLLIPEDVAVVGFDDDTNEADLFPALTTVAQPHLLVGDVAVRLLLQAMGGIRTGLPLLVPPLLVLRDSCGESLPARP